MNSEQVLPPLPENPYWVFIGFLYAFIAAEIANRFWKVSGEKLRGKRVSLWSHLVLASFIVGTSWIAWSQSFKDRSATAPEEVISWQAVMVIIDFAILGIYFSFVSIIVSKRELDEKPEPPDHCQKHASYWISLIFTMYVFWDIFAYLIIPWRDKQGIYFLDYSWSSILCACLVWLAYHWLKSIRSDRVLWIVIGDVSLIALILFYRALKQMSHIKPTPPSLTTQIELLPGHLHGHWLSIFALISLLVFAGLAYLAGAAGRHPAGLLNGGHNTKIPKYETEMIMKEANVYLILDGNCAEAMKFYQKSLGAELLMTRFGEMPGGCPEGMEAGKDRIMHARLTKGAKVVLMASDTMPGHPFQQGNNFSIALDCESAQEVDKYFAALAEKGKVTMPVQETFWAARFGMLTDQFGINWMFNLDKPKQ